MGNEESKNIKQFQIQLEHPRITRAKIITEDKKKVLETALAVDEKQYKKWKEDSSKSKLFAKHLFIPSSETFSRNGLCGQSGILTLRYQNYPYMLSEEIYNRKGRKTRFSQEQLWLLLFSLGQAHFEAQSYQFKLGDVRPLNIFLNEQGNIKVINQLSWPMEPTNIQKTMDKTATYISPQDLGRVARGEYFEGPSQISEAFSIGLTVLGTANLTEYQSLYNTKDYSFDGARLHQQILNLNADNFYSEVLRGTIMALCNLNPDRRLDCKELNEFLQRHTQRIQSRVSFVVDNAPDKLHGAITELRILQQHLRPKVIPQVFLPPIQNPIFHVENLQKRTQSSPLKHEEPIGTHEKSPQKIQPEVIKPLPSRPTLPQGPEHHE